MDLTSIQGALMGLRRNGQNGLVRKLGHTNNKIKQLAKTANIGTSQKTSNFSCH